MRRSRWALGVLSLVVGATLLAPAPAEAQSVHVSNLTQSTGDSTVAIGANQYIANSFTIPAPASARYSLTSVVVDAADGFTTETVKIYSESSSNPSSQEGGDLTKVGTSTSGQITYNAPASGITLNGGTTYFMVITCTSNCTADQVTANAQSGTTNWSIGDA